MLRTFTDTYTCNRCKVELAIALKSNPVPKVMDLDSKRAFKDAGWDTLSTEEGSAPVTLCPECTSDAWSFLNGSDEWERKIEDRSNDGVEALQLRQALEKLLSASPDVPYWYRVDVAEAFESIPGDESKAYRMQQGGSHEAYCLRTGITRILSHMEPSGHIQKHDLMRLFEEVSPSDSSFIPGRGYTSERYRTRQ